MYDQTLPVSASAGHGQCAVRRATQRTLRETTRTLPGEEGPVGAPSRGADNATRRNELTGRPEWGEGGTERPVSAETAVNKGPVKQRRVTQPAGVSGVRGKRCQVSRKLTTHTDR